MKKFLSFIIFCLVFFFVFTKPSLALDTYYRAKVTKILEDKVITIQDVNQRYQKLELKIVDPKLKDQPAITLDNGSVLSVNTNYYQVNDWVYLNQEIDPISNQTSYQIADADRGQAIFFLFAIFIILVLLISSWHGFRSLLSMFISFLIIFFYMLPNLYRGTNPILVVSISTILIIPITFYLSHGLNRKTTSAIIGTLISLFIAIILSIAFIKLGKLSGTTSEESGFLLALKPGFFNFKFLLLSGIVIGVLGVIDDITISQSAIVAQLKSAKVNNKKIFSQAMSIGKDHISSMINTLILVYAGASLPLLLLFVDSQIPLSQLISFEPIAEEIIRTLIGSIALIIAVPITTLIAIKVIQKN